MFGAVDAKVSPSALKYEKYIHQVRRSRKVHPSSLNNRPVQMNCGLMLAATASFTVLNRPAMAGLLLIK